MGGLFSKPKEKPPVPVPDEEDPAVLRARQQSILAAKQRGGRQSTVIANGADALGSSPGGAA